MNVLLLYYSKGGNTRRLAEAIGEGVDQVDGVEAVLRHTKDVTKDDFVGADGLINRFTGLLRDDGCSVEAGAG